MIENAPYAGVLENIWEVSWILGDLGQKMKYVIFLLVYLGIVFYAEAFYKMANAIGNVWRKLMLRSLFQRCAFILKTHIILNVNVWNNILFEI